MAPAQRRRGWGSALLRFAESVAEGRGRKSLYGYFEIPGALVDGSDRILAAKSGAGGLPLDEASTAFAVNSGYELEQVERSSQLDLPVPADQLERLAREAAACAHDYRIVGWAEVCPAELVGQYADLKARMSTDAPIAGLDWDAEVWDSARVRYDEQSQLRGRGQTLVAAALHKRTGQLVAYTVLNWRPGIPSSIIQQDTLVSSAHRRKKLGLLIKAANLRAAQQRWPSARSVLTWNAVENRHMLAINIALGFRPAGCEGEWQKRLG